MPRLKVQAKGRRPVHPVPYEQLDELDRLLVRAFAAGAHEDDGVPLVSAGGLRIGAWLRSSAGREWLAHRDAEQGEPC